MNEWLTWWNRKILSFTRIKMVLLEKPEYFSKITLDFLLHSIARVFQFHVHSIRFFWHKTLWNTIVSICFIFFGHCPHLRSVAILRRWTYFTPCIVKSSANLYQLVVLSPCGSWGSSVAILWPGSVTRVNLQHNQARLHENTKLIKWQQTNEKTRSKPGRFTRQLCYI